LLVLGEIVRHFITQTYYSLIQGYSLISLFGKGRNIKFNVSKYTYSIELLD